MATQFTLEEMYTGLNMKNVAQKKFDIYFFENALIYTRHFREKWQFKVQWLTSKWQFKVQWLTSKWQFKVQWLTYKWQFKVQWLTSKWQFKV